MGTGQALGPENRSELLTSMASKAVALSRETVGGTGQALRIVSKCKELDINVSWSCARFVHLT